MAKNKKPYILLICILVVLVVLCIALEIANTKDKATSLFPDKLGPAIQYLVYSTDDPNHYTSFYRVADGVTPGELTMIERIINSIVDSNMWCLTSSFRNPDDKWIGDWSVIEKEVAASYDWMIIGIVSSEHDNAGRIRTKEWSYRLLVAGEKWILYDSKNTLVAASTQWGEILSSLKRTVLIHGGGIYKYEIKDGENLTDILFPNVK